MITAPGSMGGQASTFGKRTVQMIIQPDRYECPEHHTDLTGQVAEMLEALDDSREAGGGMLSRLRRVARAQKPFEVLVTCPGSGAGGPHVLACAGVYFR